MPYEAPLADMMLALEHAGLANLHADFTPDVAKAVLEEAAKFTSARLVPLGASGDREGVKLSNGRISVASGFTEAYRDWCVAGWNGLAGPVEYGGQGLPALVNAACTEMWNAASMSFGLCPMLTVSAVEALHHHGSDELKKIYLEKLVSGEWTGTMQLTEPQAGTDLGEIRTRAEKQTDGTYKLFGQKIFITWGEHEMTPNIIHLILARVAGAPAGVKGLSLFLAPKFLVGKDGKPGARNDAHCSGIEHKLGIHAAPTCTMVYGDHGGAAAYLIGEENRGINCMFTMMNAARLAVGLQGVGVAEAATQHAFAYANERRQSRAQGATASSPIIEHPDVKRMLLEMRAKTAAARLICYMTAAALDRKDTQERAALLTPIAKAFSTDIANEVTSLGIQVHGGMGYIEETGAARFYRDARIAAIYEGTNGIQANDLLMRKLPIRDGGAMRDEIAIIRDVAERIGKLNIPDFGESAAQLNAAADALESASTFMLRALAKEPQTALAGAVSYLRLAALGVGGAALAGAALRAHKNDWHAPAQLARFFAAQQLPLASGLAGKIMTGGESIIAAKFV